MLMDQLGDDIGSMALEGTNGAPKKPATHMSNTFHERIARGNNLTKMGNSSSPRDTAMLIAAQVFTSFERDQRCLEPLQSPLTSMPMTGGHILSTCRLAPASIVPPCKQSDHRQQIRR